MLASERKALTRFLLVYGGSMLLFIAAVAYGYYHFEHDRLTEKHFTILKNLKQELVEQMRDARKPELLEKAHYPMVLYDRAGQRLLGDAEVPLISTQFGWHEREGAGYFVSRFPARFVQDGILVIQDLTLRQGLQQIFWNMVGWVLAALLFAGLVSLFLARIFLKPMRENIQHLDAFIKDATHEMNTPLSSILMSIETIDVAQTPPPLAKKLTRIANAAKTLSHLYDDLVFANFSGKFPVMLEDCRMEMVIQERIDYFRPIADAKGIQWDCNIQSCPLRCDAKRVRRIIDNLLSNAIKYSHPQGLIEVVLDENRLYIRNGGAVIPPQKQEEVFERYRRFNADQGGFGIGLSTAATLSYEMGFSLSIRPDSQGGAEAIMKFAVS